MRQARFRKAVWLILLVELILFHFGVLFRLYVLRWEHPEVRYLKQLLPVWAAGAGVLSLWQLLAYQGFRRKALQAVDRWRRAGFTAPVSRRAGEAGLSGFRLCIRARL